MKNLKFGCLGMVILFVGLLALGEDEEDINSTGNKYANEGYAYTLAKEKIQEILKAPSTAEFASYGNYTVTREGDTFYIDSYVDSQNGFGAMLRSYFKVAVTFEGEYVRTQILEFK